MIDRPTAVAVTILASLFASLALAGEAPTTAPSTRPAVEKVDVERFDALRNDAKAVVLDVRTPEEFAAGHLPGAVNVPVNTPAFESALATLDKEKPYLVHCMSGRRSAVAVREMQAAGFAHLYDLKGGYAAWSFADKPTEKSGGDQK